MNRKKIS
jgi:mitogen-activated protein kinase 1/3